MTSSQHNLAEIYKFFNSSGTERLSGLNESYFENLTQEHKEEVWNFLKKDFQNSTERIRGLYILNRERAVSLFKIAIEMPVKYPPYPEVREDAESSRLLMISYVYASEHDKKYITSMCDYALSEFEDVRGQFARALPIDDVTAEAEEALKNMILTESEIIPLTAAITKFMVIHGMDFNRHDPVYKATYMSLQSDNTDEKLAAIKRLERLQRPNHL
jgi:hypothetical protein